MLQIVRTVIDGLHQLVLCCVVVSLYAGCNRVNREFDRARHSGAIWTWHSTSVQSAYRLAGAEALAPCLGAVPRCHPEALARRHPTAPVTEASDEDSQRRGQQGHGCRRTGDPGVA